MKVIRKQLSEKETVHQSWDNVREGRMWRAGGACVRKTEQQVQRSRSRWLIGVLQE